LTGKRSYIEVLDAKKGGYTMKVLVAYFSQTGNTEQIAKAICGEATAAAHEAELKKVEDVSAADLAGYDVVFVGSPIHGNGLAAPVGELMNALPEGSSFKLAGFVTHASSAYEKEGFDAGMQSLGEISAKKNITYLGAFDCEGRMAEMLQPMVKEARGISDEDWNKRMAELGKHPSAEDEQKAKDFAREILSKA
jgi:flavodoxin I